MLNKTPGGVKQALLRIRIWLRQVRQETGESEVVEWVLKTDQGGEFVAMDLRDWAAEVFGTWETVPTGRHVAPAERLVRTVAEGTRTLLSAAGLPATFWAFAAVAFCWNRNLQNDAWRAMCQRRGYLTEPHAFGRSCHVKLAPGVDPNISKADERGRPAAYLGPSLWSRRGVFVLFLGSDGKYHTVLTERRGVVFVEPEPDRPPVMAFERRYEDLQTLAVPGEMMQTDGGFLRQWLRHRLERKVLTIRQGS